MKAVCRDQVRLLSERQETRRPSTWIRCTLLLRLEWQELRLRFPAGPEDADIRWTVQAYEGTSRNTNGVSLVYVVLPFMI